MTDITWDIEVWRDYPEFPDRYQVSSCGKVMSKSYLKQGRNSSGSFAYWTVPSTLKSSLTEDGYLQLRLQVDGHKVTRKVHRMVALTFLENTENLADVNHKDSCRTNNTVENLEWCSSQYNSLHGFQFGFRSSKGERHPRAVLSEEIVLEVKRMDIAGFSCRHISDTLGFKYDTIKKVLQRKNWREYEPDGSPWKDGIFCAQD